MKITSYPDMSVLDDKTMDSIIAHEREAFGYKGFGEYLFCANPQCRRILSIDEVYGTSDTNRGYVPLEELEKDGPKMPNCPDCDSPSLLVFDPKILKPHLASLYRGACGALLTDENGVVRGSSLVQATNLRDCFDGINYREGLDWDEFRDRTAETLGIDPKSDMNVMVVNRIAINRPFREGGTLIKLGAASGLHTKPEQNEWPTFACVRYDGGLLSFMEAIGYKLILEDPYGAVAVGLEKFGELKRAFNLSFEDFAKKYGDKMMSATVKARSRAKAIAGPKYYRGVSLLDELQKRAEKLKQGFEAHDRQEISPELISEVADQFRELFNNAYAQYLFYPSEGEPISPRQIFGTDDYIPLEQLDALDPDQHRHPETGERPRFWHDPETVRQRLSHLRDDGQLALSRNPESDEIDAFAFGYRSTVGEAFKREEWRNPTNYSGYENPERLRDLGNFLRYLNETIGKNREAFGNSGELSAESQVYISNMFGVMPEARRKGKMKELSRGLYGMLHERKIEVDIGLLETQIGSVAHQVFLKAGAVNVPGALDIPGKKAEHDITLMAFPFDSFTKYFLG